MKFSKVMSCMIALTILTTSTVKADPIAPRLDGQFRVINGVMHYGFRTAQGAYAWVQMGTTVPLSTPATGNAIPAVTGGGIGSGAVVWVAGTAVVVAEVAVATYLLYQLGYEGFQWYKGATFGKELDDKICRVVLKNYEKTMEHCMYQKDMACAAAMTREIVNKIRSCENR